MKKIAVYILLMFCMLSTHGQERNFNHLSYGFQLVRFQDEFGIGLHILTPGYKNLRVNIRTNLNWLSHLDNQYNQSWSSFFNAQTGINYHRCISDRINLYTEGGVVGILPNATFSDEDINIGGYGLFGFEFFFTADTNRNPSYFIELGGIGTGAVANRIISNPIYANGFLIAVGYRF